ncbi:MAG TPA: flagellar hook capping FlgD N-terminal domain-containing protein [Gaiellaceae bacterium]|nr:flagellar hook capping FlgD N-terminal domain-containing protein [Gaiellaceae bacterium]
MSSVNPTSQTTGSGSSAPVNPSTNLNDQDFLQLLVAQLKYQDPMSPTDDQSFIQEQAQFSTVEGITSLESTMTAMGAQQAMSSAVNLIGTQVDYTASDGSAQSGVVSSVANASGTVTLHIGSSDVPFSSITKVSLPSSDPSSSDAGSTSTGGTTAGG